MWACGFVDIGVICGVRLGRIIPVFPPIILSFDSPKTSIIPII